MCVGCVKGVCGQGVCPVRGHVGKALNVCGPMKVRVWSSPKVWVCGAWGGVAVGAGARVWGGQWGEGPVGGGGCGSPTVQGVVWEGRRRMLCGRCEGGVWEVGGEGSPNVHEGP